MAEIGIRELKLHTSEILRRVREEHASFLVTHRGRVVARIVPVSDRTGSASVTGIWSTMDDLAEEIAASWPAGQTAAEAIDEQRR